LPSGKKELGMAQAKTFEDAVEQLRDFDEVRNGPSTHALVNILLAVVEYRRAAEYPDALKALIAEFNERLAERK
jgi:hypothetical protein